MTVVPFQHSKPHDDDKLAQLAVRDTRLPLTSTEAAIAGRGQADRAKAIVGHGGWLKWLREHVGMKHGQRRITCGSPASQSAACCEIVHPGEPR